MYFLHHRPHHPLNKDIAEVSLQDWLLFLLYKIVFQMPITLYNDMRLEDSLDGHFQRL
ncbi:hypothetical protein BDA99DRAFT_500369 [Phascolomyces articulosus]|uniref:Uncharacterized protein n=1 Tax=Phascolomyces articulosus TaxID=60185 RepID=A0AAD5PH91_9FUNG|nr:hypothetical protein BDA99DRAFT_500369 [Phascolomyces articulosus]